MASPFWRRAARLGAATLLAYARSGSAAPVDLRPVMTPPAPGMEPQYQTPRDQSALSNMLQQWDALFGRGTYRLGPTNPRWSTFNGECTPEAITSAIDLANAGQPFQFYDMCRRQVENDAHLGGTVEMAFSSIVAKQSRIEPPRTMRRDSLAVSLANWQRAVVEQIEGFDRSRYGLLWAEGMGYAASENVYAYRPLTWFAANGERITKTYLLPVEMPAVEGRAFRFDTATDEPLLWLEGGHASLPKTKFVFHQAYGLTSLIERRGFMRGAIWPSAMKQWDLRDMAIYLHMYGLPQMIAEYDPKQYSYPEAVALAQKIQEQLGQGGIPTTGIGAFGLRSDTPAPSGALVHRDAAMFLNDEISKRVTLGLLTMSSSGGSYGLGDIHAEGAFDGKLLRAGSLCESLRRDLFAPCVALNVLRLALDLGYAPPEIMAALPEYRAQLLREDNPEARQRIFSQAAKDGVQVSKAQYRGELHLDEPSDEKDVVLGEATSVPSAGATVGAVEASKGAIAPPQETAAPPAPQEQA